MLSERSIWKVKGILGVTLQLFEFLVAFLWHMHSLLCEYQRKCNSIIEPRSVNTSSVGTACSVHGGKTSLPRSKSFLCYLVVCYFALEDWNTDVCYLWHNICICVSCCSVWLIRFQTTVDEIWLSSWKLLIDDFAELF